VVIFLGDFMHALIKKAMEFATKAHMSQTYSPRYPYFKHLEDVYNVLIEFGFKEDNPEDLPVLQGGWLHDTMEDTATSYSDLKNIFGEELAEIVYCDTDELGRNRKEKKEKTFPKTRSNGKSVIIKVADRIANVRFALQEQSPQLEMYKKEHTEFQYNLRIYKHIEPMWECLDKLLQKAA
jgi:(p)ppGpp synthase/HD superfamily hydrolase